MNRRPDKSAAAKFDSKGAAVVGATIGLILFFLLYGLSAFDPGVGQGLAALLWHGVVGAALFGGGSAVRNHFVE